MIGGALFGMGAGAGLWLLVLTATARRPSLFDRVLPYVPQGSRARVEGPLGLFAGHGLRSAADLLGRVLGGSASVQRRLDRLGSSMSVGEFRSRQVVAGLAGLGIATALCLWLGATREPNLIALLVLCAVGFAVGVAGRERWLSRRLRDRERRQSEEFPTAAEYMALAVAAGETPNAALERVVAVTHGELSVDLRAVLGRIRTGESFVEAMDGLAARTGVATIARFAEALAVAVERGTPLVDVLHAQAADVREAARRELIETASRREIAMMLPVVFLLLPTTVLIAFYPGFIGLSLGIQ